MSSDEKLMESYSVNEYIKYENTNEILKCPRWFHFVSEKYAKSEMERILVNFN